MAAHLPERSLRLIRAFWLGMPTQLIQLHRINWDRIYPPLAEKMFALAAICLAKGASYYAISGYRSYAEQDALYAQGRTKPGSVVTRAKAGQSAHNFGLAVDWCRDADAQREGLQPDWDLASYRILAEEAAALGLESGLSWKTFREGPHVQLDLGQHDVTLAKLDEVYRRNGIQGVWRYLDQLSWS